MPNSRPQTQEFDVAMRALDELCAQHRIKNNDKLREIFWEGVVLGWNRSAKRSVRRDQKEKKPVRPKASPPAAMRDSRVESGIGIPDQPPKQVNDLSDAGMFRL